MATLRSTTDEVRRAFFIRLRTSFNHTNVSGLSGDPTFTQNPQRTTEEPYIYLYSVGESEVDTTLVDSGIEYQINVETLVRYRSYRGGSRQAQEIINECQRILRSFNDFPDISSSGFTIYKAVTGDTNTLTFKEKGANYVKVVMPLFITARFSGFATEVQPEQTPIYAFNGFTFNPTQNRLEQGDAGTITGASTYSSGNNGWDFVSVGYTQIQGGDGSLTGNDYTVEASDVTLGLTSTIDYQFTTDNAVTTSLTATTAFNRIRSIRYGATTLGSITLSDIQDFSNWTGTNQTFNYGTVNPVGESISFTGQAGDRLYIIYDADFSIQRLRDGLGFNHISAFTETTVGNYKILLQTNPLVFDTSQAITYTIS